MYARVSNKIFYAPNALVYEKSVYSTVLENETEGKEGTYNTSNTNEKSIYNYRYDEYLTGSHDHDLDIVPKSEIPLHKKDTPIPSKPETHDNAVCGLGEDGKSICGDNSELYKILDPRFNLREAAKNMLLLEDHLFQCGKRCSDCIKKHCMLIEGFLEEGLTLDKERTYIKLFEEKIKEFRTIFKQIAEKLQKNNTLTDDDCITFAQEIRKIRKPLCQTYSTFF